MLVCCSLKTGEKERDGERERGDESCSLGNNITSSSTSLPLDPTEAIGAVNWTKQARD